MRNLMLSAALLVFLFSTARADVPDAAVLVAAPVATPSVGDPEHEKIYQEIVALRTENAKLKVEVAAPKPVGTQGVMASLPVIFGLLAVLIRRMKPPASMVHETWFIPVSTALAAVLSALAETSATGALTWNTAIAASVGALSTWAGASYTNPKVQAPTLVEPPAGGTT